MANPLALLCCLILSVLQGSTPQYKSPTLRDKVRQEGHVRSVGVADDFIPSLDKLVSGSDLILRGRVVDESTRLSSDEYAVYTDYTIEILDVYKDDQSLVRVGDRIVVTRYGGNIVVEGKPISLETINVPPIRWVVPHVFFIRKPKGFGADAQYYFAGDNLGPFVLERGKIVCEAKKELRHSVAAPFCDKSELQFLQTLREKIEGQQ